MGKLLLFLVFGAIVAFGTFSISMNEKINDGVDNAVIQFERSSARNIASSVIGLARLELKADPKWKAGYTNLQIDGGSATLTVTGTLYGNLSKGKGKAKGKGNKPPAATDSVLVLNCTGTFGQNTSNVVVVLTAPSPDLPPVVRGAITTFGAIDHLVSDMYIDGRDHATDNKVIAGSGTFSVSTGQATFTNNEEGILGGTYYTGGIPTDVKTSYPENPLIVETSASWPNGWPTTPDAAIGLPVGTLKAIAQSGVGGSQYFTTYNGPGWTKTVRQDYPTQYMSPPLQGVTYIEVPDNKKWKGMTLNDKSSGIVIFHSPNTTAYWEYLYCGDGDQDGWPAKPFKGLLIFDKVFHLHLDVIGALVQLKPWVASGSCGGNEDHFINFSRQTITDGLKVAGIELGVGSFGNKFDVVSWWE